MKVLQIGPYPPPHGGVQTNLVAIREQLQKSNCPSLVINITRFRKPEGDGVYYPKNALGLLHLLWKLDYDIVHLHFGGELTPRILGLGFVCSLVPQAKTVLTFHSGGYPSSVHGRRTRSWGLRAFVLRRFDRIIAVNNEILEFLHRIGVSPAKTKLIMPFSFPSSDANVEIGLSPQILEFYQSHRPVMITVGLLEEEYDLPLQIDVLGSVRKRYPNAGLVIIGAGSLEQDLRERIANAPERKHILLCGDVPHRVTLRAISLSDVMLRTTRYDGDAISVREGLQLGTPVIATENGMRPSGVHKIPVGNMDALRKMIEGLLSAPRELKKIEPRNSEENIEAVLALYRELLAGK